VLGVLLDIVAGRAVDKRDGSLLGIGLGTKLGNTVG
jgi:hypothetical protein